MPRYRYGVPLVAAAVCPHPPLIVPELAAGAAPELDDLRTACATAVVRLRAARPDRIVVLGSASTPVTSFAPWGVPVPLSGGALPLAHAVGSWLLGATAADFVLAPGEVAVDPGRVALLVMGDGSICRGEKSPGYHDVRAEPFDRAVSAALATVDTRALLALDRGLAGELRVAGLDPWRELARVVAADGRDWRGEVLYDDAPYGVAYFVATWQPA